MVPDVPPLDLQWIRGYPRPSEGAGHLHILTPLSSHITRHLCEHGWTDTEGDTVNEQTQQWTNYSVAFEEKVRKLRIFLFLFYFGPRESRFSKIFNLKYMFCFGKAQNLLKQFDSLALWCLRGFTTLTHKNCFSSSKHKTRKDSQHKMWHHVSSSDDYQVMYHITVKSVLGKNLHLLWQQLIVGWLYIMTNKWLQRANLSSSSVAFLRC